MFCSYILDCIAGGCTIHLDPAHYSFDTVSAVSAIRLSCPSNERSTRLAASRAHALEAFSCVLTHIADLIALDVSEAEMSSCMQATRLLASQECGRELPLSFLSKHSVTSGLSRDAAFASDVNEADMQFLHEYASACCYRVVT
jgi:CheY-like chemotaxis protein